MCMLVLVCVCITKASLTVCGWCQVHLLKPWRAGNISLIWAVLAPSPGTEDKERCQHFSDNALAAEGRRQISEVGFVGEVRAASGLQPACEA